MHPKMMERVVQVKLEQNPKAKAYFKKLDKLGKPKGFYKAVENEIAKFKDDPNLPQAVLELLTGLIAYKKGYKKVFFLQEDVDWDLTQYNGVMRLTIEITKIMDFFCGFFDCKDKDESVELMLASLIHIFNLEGLAKQMEDNIVIPKE